MIKTLKSKIKSYLIIGIATFIPAYITILLIIKIISFFDDLMKRLLSIVYIPHYLSFLKYPGMGGILSFFFFILLGFFSRQYIGKKFLFIIDKAFSLFPIAREIYLAIKKLAESIFGKEKREFKRVVFVPFPHKDVKAIGFITGELADDFQKDQQYYVYVPTAINPTSGFLIVVRETDIIKSELTVEEAFALILSGGMATPNK